MQKYYFLKNRNWIGIDAVDMEMAITKFLISYGYYDKCLTVDEFINETAKSISSDF